MATKAPGFLSADGKYFPTERDALEHETAQAALTLVGRRPGADAPRGLYEWLLAAQRLGIKIALPGDD